MATITYSLSKKHDKSTGASQVLVRFVVGSRINQRAKSGIFVPSEYWRDSSQSMTVPKWRLMNEEQRRLVETLNGINAQLQGLRAAVMESFIMAGAGKKPIPGDWLSSVVDHYLHPEDASVCRAFSLEDGFHAYLSGNRISYARTLDIKVVLRSVLRYQAYTKTVLLMDQMSSEDLRGFERFLRNEMDIVAEHPELLDVCPESRPVKPRCENTIIGRLKRLRAVILWNVANGNTDNNPFRRFRIGQCVYGTPVIISIEERNALYRFDLSSRPALAVQRDIFVFQCLIGCRVSDLLKLTRDNLIDGAIEYVARKTKDNRPFTVRVPLNALAMEIVRKYEDENRPALLPFISAQNYNDSLKEMFTLAGLTRKVTVLDPMTRQEVQRPLNEIIASHLARKSFVGCLYRQVADPDLIGKLTGHTEGSRAFARYRDIDEDMRKGLVKLLE